MSIKVALAGNPNTGKTTIFNALTGLNQFVGNWPGVTVEKKEGKYRKDHNITIVDLPGIYSLSPYTLEEVIARNYIIDEKPDGILNIIDGPNLERNLYLTTQLIELNVPTVIVVNMNDVIKKKGDEIKLEVLEKFFGCKAIFVSAINKENIDEAMSLLLKEIKQKNNPSINISYGEKIEGIFNKISTDLTNVYKRPLTRFELIKLFEEDEKAIEALKFNQNQKNIVKEIIDEYKNGKKINNEKVIAEKRWDYIDQNYHNIYFKKDALAITMTEKVDRIVTNRWLALPIFVVVMTIVYYISVTTVGGFVTDWTNEVLFGEIIPPFIENILVSLNVAEWLQSLILNGIVAGVGAVLGFVPQMIVLFIFLALLEGCGYMARIAFIMDRIFRKIGLSGKSFIPMLIGTGCSVPGIMASRTIDKENDRRMTIITTSFLPCSAKLPLIAMISGALFNNAWWVAPSAYFVGILAIIISGLILKKTKVFVGDLSPFVMELPPYYMPDLGSMARVVWERASSFITKAGTVILLSSIVIWLGLSFGVVDGSFTMLEESEINLSLMARFGSFVAPIFKPLGFADWKTTVGVITGLVAKENLITTLGIIYQFEEIDEIGTELFPTLAMSFTTYSAYAYLVFNLICAPCFAAIGAIKREMNNYKWTAFAVAYQTVLAYVMAMIVYQFGAFFAEGTIGIGLFIAIISLILMIYLILRKPVYTKKEIKA